MKWKNYQGHNRRLEYSLSYDERSGLWLAHVRTSNRHHFTKRFKSANQANEWYRQYKSEYCMMRGLDEDGNNIGITKARFDYKNSPQKDGINMQD